jgi:phospholipid methyltransferase
MNRAALLLVVLDFLVIGALPVVFFRRDGRFKLMWWLTAWPFFICPVLLIAAFAGWWPLSPRWSRLLGPGHDLLALPVSAASLALVFFTLGTHRVPIALWHQSDDAPRNVVTFGAYHLIRHPFYAAFLLAFLAASLLLPHPLVLLQLAYVFVVLNATAAREERKLAASAFGEEYREYMARTGRFVPRWSAGR